MTTETVTASELPPAVVRPWLRQRWHAPVFVHWPVEPAEVAARLPDGLGVDSFDGAAWVGITVTRLALGVGPLPGVGPLGRYGEAQVRSYVRDPDGRTGVWLHAVHTGSWAAAALARRRHHLPAAHAAVQVAAEDGVAAYEVRGDRGAGLQLVVEAAGPRDPDRLGLLDHFLASRSRLFLPGRSGLAHVEVAHAGWPLHHARVVRLQESLLRGAGLPAPLGDPVVHWSPELELGVGRAVMPARS